MLLFAILITSPLIAHDMYMWPHFQDKSPKKVSLAMLVQKDEVVWFESMTEGLRMDGPSGEANLAIPEEGDPVVEFDKEGTYVIGWESEPLFVEVNSEIFKKYIAIEGYPGVADVRNKSNQEDKPAREIYTRFVKTFVQVGPNFTEDFNRPFGYLIELIPAQNPCSLRVDSELDVRVLYHGKPLPNHRIMATYNSYSDVPEEYAQVTRTDKDGIAKFRITHKGLWLIRANEMVQLKNNPEADWQSFWANFTFEVK